MRSLGKVPLRVEPKCPLDMEGTEWVVVKWWTPLLQLNKWTPGLLLLPLNQWTSLYLELQKKSLHPSLYT